MAAPATDPAPGPVTPTRLRAELFQLLDRVIETGEPLEIRRNGRILKIVVEQPTDKLARITPHPDFIVGDPDQFLEPTPYEWDPDRAINP